MNLEDIVPRCQKDPEFFISEVLGQDAWPKQVEIMEAVRDHDVVAVPSCHSSGKSWVAARIILWFVSCFAGSKGVTTAPTERQVKGILWSELRSAYGQSRYNLGGTKPTSLNWEIEPDWYVTGFTAPDFDPNRFQGFHAPHIMVLQDEAAGISANIADQISSLRAGGHARELQIGNPVQAKTSFHKSCQSKAVKVIAISAFDTPNFTEFDILEEDILSGRWKDKIKRRQLPAPWLITPHWVAERLEIWGEESNKWKSRILGEFPDTVEGAYYGEAMQRVRDTGRIGKFPHDVQKKVYTAWDIGIGDSTAIWFIQFNGNAVMAIDYVEATGQGLPYYAQQLAERDYLYGGHIAPFDMRNREWGSGGQSRVASAQELGLTFQVLANPATREAVRLADGIDAVRGILPRCYFDEEHCAEGIATLESYQRKPQPGGDGFLEIPLHNWASHGADAFRTLAVGMHQQKINPEVMRQRRPGQPRRSVT